VSKELIEKLRGTVMVRDPVGNLHPLNAPELLEAADTIERLTKERDEARANYAFMVKKAADESLPAYREMGQKCADLERERDEARSEVTRLRTMMRKDGWRFIACTKCDHKAAIRGNATRCGYCDSALRDDI
jgi:hypothetical protein